jgi:hypothetical protein
MTQNVTSENSGDHVALPVDVAYPGYDIDA